MQPVQMRMVGPMKLVGYTQPELEHLRAVVGMPNSKIKYMAISGAWSGSSTLTVYAQGFTKLTVFGWRKQLGKRLTNVVPVSVEDMRTGIPECEETYGWPPFTGAGFPCRGNPDAIVPPPPRKRKAQAEPPVPAPAMSQPIEIPVQNEIAATSTVTDNQDDANTHQEDEQQQPRPALFQPIEIPVQNNPDTIITTSTVTDKHNEIPIVCLSMDYNLIQFLHKHTSKTRGTMWPRKGSDVWDEFQRLAVIYYRQTNTRIHHAHTATVAHAMRTHPDQSIEWLRFAVLQVSPRPSIEIDQELLDYLHIQPLNPLVAPVSAWAIISQNVTRYYNITGKNELSNHKRTKAYALITHPNALESWGVFALNMLSDSTST